MAKAQEFEIALREIQIGSLKDRLQESWISHKRKSDDLAIYSTFCGPADALSLSVNVKDLAADFYFISNNPACLKKAGKLGWIPFHLDVGIYQDAVISSHQAKIAKAMPHLFEFLTEYERVFYLDDKFRFDSQFLAKLESAFAGAESPFIASHHAFLDKNIMFELAEAMGQPRYFLQRTQIVEFILGKLNEGYRLDMEKMYETGLIMRDLNHPEVREINEEWYQSIIECGIQCQISFNFIAQKYRTITSFDKRLLSFR